MIVNGLTVIVILIPLGVTTRYYVRRSVIRHVMYVLNEDVLCCYYYLCQKGYEKNKKIVCRPKNDKLIP